ncbi:MAG: iron-containing alcohol dehydrogenase [Christensenellales bacterium]|jgi:4-hydroxybutyrate dehydrogenase
MNFSVKPAITSADSLLDFFREWQVGAKDLIVTNAYVLQPALKGEAVPCDVLYQENYGQGEPSDEMVDAMLAAIDGKDYERIIAVGGGTVIDIAKLFVFGDDLRCEEIFDRGANLSRKRKLLIIPTTCGTGSEVTGISIIGFVKKDTKIGLAVPALFPDEAVLIGSMLSTLPYEVFATSSIDALIHAVESYVSPKANAFTRSMGRSAIEMILRGYGQLAATGKRDLPEDMQPYLEASTMAGIAFGNAGCAAVHALSYPIGGGYHVPHGKANYMVFQAVFAAYRRKGADLSPLEDVLTGVLGDGDVWRELFDLLGKVYDNQTLGSLGADRDKCAEMAASVVANQQRLLGNNPVELTQEDIREIFESCL